MVQRIRYNQLKQPAPNEAVTGSFTPVCHIVTHEELNHAAHRGGDKRKRNTGLMLGKSYVPLFLVVHAKM